MKKILFLLAAASLTLTSCMKEDETYKRMQPIMPGLYIIDGALTQQRIATQPLDQVIRLAMLVAEGDLQQKAIDELPSMTVPNGEGKTINVFDRLFRNKTTITKSAEGNYTIELSPESTGSYTCEGTMTVMTNGVPLLRNTDSKHPWTVTLPEGFKVRMGSKNTPEGYQELLVEGSFHVYWNGIYYSMQLSYIKAYMKVSSSIASSWSGTFDLTPPTGGESLAFSGCMGKKFRLNGDAYGPTCISFNGTTGAQMRYSIENGLYVNYLQCLDGTEKAWLTGYGDYDSTMYPASNVQIDWELSADEKSLSQTIIYNGHTVTL